MTDEQKKYPKITTGATIINKAGKFFLMRSPVFHDQLVIPGGHVEWGESLEECLKREVKEETGLTVYDPVFLCPVEFILSDLYKSDKHIVSLDFIVRTNDPENAVKLDGREGIEYVWLSKDEIVGRVDIEPTTRKTLNIYFEQQKKESELVEYKLGWQRAVADYKNLQKETQERRAEWVSMSEQQIVEDFIPVYDNFKKAFAHHPELKSSDENNKQIKNWIDGIGFIQKQFQEVMKAHKVVEIKTVGETFDARLHESVGEAPSGDGVSAALRKPDTIVQEVEGGYMMGGRVVKVARVIIAK